MRNNLSKLVSVDRLVKRTTNRGAILREIHFGGPMRRADLSRRLKIRKSSITSIAAELVQRGVVAEEKSDNSRSRLSLNEVGRYVLAAQLAIGQVHIARVMLNGTVLNRKTIPFELNLPADQILRIIEDAL